MVDVRGDVLRPPHGTTPAAVKSNKNQKWDPLRAMKTKPVYVTAQALWIFSSTDVIANKNEEIFIPASCIFLPYSVKTKLNEPVHDKTNKMACVSSEDSDQPGHQPSLIRPFTVCMNKAWVLSYPLSAQRRLIRLGRCPGIPVFSGLIGNFVGFVLRWPKF